MCRVYPRLCGGNARVRYCKPCLGGLSPLVRGKRVGVGKFSERAGSIPACAGETFADHSFLGNPRGLSPLVRGKLGMGVGE